MVWQSCLMAPAMTRRLDSSNKCNKKVLKYLVRCPEAQRLARTVIKTVGNELNIGVREGGKVGFLWEVLSDEAVGIFVGASLPGRIRVGKEEVGIKAVGDSLVTRELDAVVGSDGKDLVFDRQKLIANGLGNCFG